MSNLPYHGHTYNPYVKQDMIVSDEEEENATLAEPMTLEGAKQLAQSSLPARPSAIGNAIASPLPHILPSPPHLTAPIHHLATLAAQRPLLHLVSPSSPSPSIHTASLSSHIGENTLQNSLWTNPGAPCEDEDSSEITNYPSTVDIEAIRDSPSPNGLSSKLVTINENWNTLEEHESSHGHSEEDEDEDDSDVSDSDVSYSSSKSVKKENKKVGRTSSHSESMTSKSDTDSKDSDDSSECSSSEDSSSSDEIYQTSSHSIAQHIRNSPNSELIKPSKLENKQESDSACMPKSCVTSLLATDSKWQMRQGEKCFNPAIEKNEKLFKTVSGDFSDDESKEKVQHTIKYSKSESKMRSGFCDMSNIKVESKCGNKVKSDQKFRPYILSSPEMEEKRLEKERELNREFDRLLLSCNPSLDQKSKELVSSMRLVNCKSSLPDCKKEDVKNIKPKVEKAPNYGTSSSTDSHSSLSSSETEDIPHPRKRMPCLNANAKVINKKLLEPQKSKIFLEHQKLSKHYTETVKQDRNVDTSKAAKSLETYKIKSHSLPHRGYNTHNPNPKKEKVSSEHLENLDNKKEKNKSSSHRKQKDSHEVNKNSNIIAEPPGIIHPTIADVVKVGRRRSFDSEKSVDTQNDSSSSDHEDLNEKVDLDTEQTQTFSVSENNFNQGRLTMKIAAMKMAKFGKTGLREVTTDLSTRSLLNIVAARRNRIQSSVSPQKPKTSNSPQKARHKVKTAAERKTYADSLPVLCSGRKKTSKGDMRVPATSLYRGHYGANGQVMPHRSGHFEEDEDDISQFAHHLSQISQQQIPEGLQVLDQEDLAAILPDVNGSTAAIDPFDHRNRSNHDETYIADSIVNEVFQEDKGREAHLSAKKKKSRENEDEVGELEFIPLDSSLNASNVSPDSGIQSVNGSPLHGASPNHHSPFYSNIVSNSEQQHEESSGRFSPNFQDSPPPPTLLPAITPPHLATSSPRYYDSPDSPQMPSLKCQVFPPPWDDKSCDSADEPKEVNVDESDKPKRSRGRPKGSKNKRNTYDHCWITHKSKKERSFKDLAKGGEEKSTPNKFEHGNKWRSSREVEEDPHHNKHKKKPGRPKKQLTEPSHCGKIPKETSFDTNEAKLVDSINDVEDQALPIEKIDHLAVNESTSEKKDTLKRPVGRPRKIPKSEEEPSSKVPPVTLASRKCFSEKIMHKIINEKVRNSEKSDKLTVNPVEEELPKGDIPLVKRARKRKKAASDGIPLIEDKRKKRGRRKELPAIFEKVYGSLKSIKHKPDKSGISSLKKKKKKKKAFKSKHKNIIDPVFLERLEDLILDFDKCYISKGFITPQAKPGEVLLPSIFRPPRKPLSSKKRRIAEKAAKASDKESGTEGDSSKERIAGKRKKKQQEVPKQGKERSESNEQRLPLKKRHRHISTAVPTFPEIVKPENRIELPPKPEKTEKPDIKSYLSKSPSRNDSSKPGKTEKKLTDKDKYFEKDKYYKKYDKLMDRINDKDRSSEKNIDKFKTSEKIIEDNTPLDGIPEKESNNNKEELNGIISEQVHYSEKASDTVSESQSHCAKTFFKKKSGQYNEEMVKDSILNSKKAVTNDFNNKKSVVDNCYDEKPQSKNSQVEKPVDKSTSVITTPKKRHRLEADLSKLSSEIYYSNVLSMHSVSSSKRLLPVVQLEGIKQEKLSRFDNSIISEKKVSSENTVLSSTPPVKIDNSTKMCINSVKEKVCDSDQSGFMSDKESSKEDEVKTAQKKLKKRKELESHQKVQSPQLIEKSQTAEPSQTKSPVHRKKVKRRKTNKTGFPVIRKKKPKPKHVESTVPVEHSVNEPNSISNSSSTLEVNKLSEKYCKVEVKRTEIPYSSPKDPSISEHEVVTEPQISNNSSLKVETRSAQESKTGADTVVIEDKNNTVEDTKPKQDVVRNRRKRRGRPKRRISTIDISAKEDPSKTVSNKIPSNEVKSKLVSVDSKAKESCKESQDLDAKSKIPERKPTEERTSQRLRKNTPRFLGKRKRDASEDSILPIEQKRPRTRAAAEEEVEDSDAYIEQPSSEPASSDEGGKVKKVPRWRRKYLVAGLFSDYYKQTEPRRNGDMNKVKLSEIENRNHSLLPPPLYCKKQLRERHREFLLPYDLWFLHVNDMLPGRDPVASWNYKKVKSNIYYDVKCTADKDVQSCNCKRPSKTSEKACGEDCINRMMFIECSPQICPVQDKCSNQRLQRHENLTCLSKFMTVDKGWGIKTTSEIKQGSFIMEYVGEVVSEREFRHRMHTKYANDTHHYCLNLDSGMMIDGHRIGSDCRFVNHSCNPNCEMQKWNVNGQYRMALFALQNITVDEELTYDYNFQLFNPARGQRCKCKASNCRGVIGGKSQRLNSHHPVVEEKKKSGRSKKDTSKKRKRGISSDTESLSKNQFMPVKPLSHQQKVFILSHRCFLLRNLNKIRNSRGRVARYQEKKVEEEPDTEEEPCSKIQRFMTHFTALNTARSVKTRRLAQAEDDPEMTRIAKLAQIFKDIYDKLVASRDDKEKPLATPFMSLFSKKKYPTYYTRVGEPIDLSIIEKNILTGCYTNVEDFDRDIMKLFGNNLRFFGRNTEIGKMAVGLRKVYSECKLQFKPLLEEVLGEGHLPTAFSECSQNEEFEDEDVIRCVCNLYRDEGMMIQCEKCLVWQHCDCMGVDENNFPEHYECEECSHRLVSPEVPMNPQPPDSDNKKYFVTLLRDSLQIKQGDSVYILRDRPKQKSGERRQPAYKLAKDIKFNDLLIFKVENLFIDDKGDKYAFGHHYLRPHETFHEPWRKFFANEVIRSPFCEIIPLDMIIKHCWVMDLNSYCRGRPIGSHEEHIHVCEYRVDKCARVFSKISKPKYPICKKPYAFIHYPEKLRPQRTYTPHEVTCSKRGKNSNDQMPEMSLEIKDEIKSSSVERSSSGSRKPRSNNSSRERSSSEQKENVKANIKIKKRDRINTVATRLLKQLPSKGAVDMAHLLKPSTGKRSRKKTSAFAS